MNKVMLWGAIVLIGVVAGWFYFNGDLRFSRSILKTTSLSTDKEAPPTDGSIPAITDESTAGGDTKGGVGELTVRYTENGFVPKEITVKKGSVITFVNTTTQGMWVASGVHPTHQLLPGFDQKTSVTNGGTYTYTFAKVGTWKYHNHVSPEITATVIVTE